MSVCWQTSVDELYLCPILERLKCYLAYSLRLLDLDSEYMRQQISRVGKKSAKDFHPHAARHWTATTLLAGDPETGMEPMDIRYVLTQLRHSSLASTQVYTHVNREQNAGKVNMRMSKFFLEDEGERVRRGMYSTVCEPFFLRNFYSSRAQQRTTKCQVRPLFPSQVVVFAFPRIPCRRR